MNSEKHTHEIKVSRYWQHKNTGCFVITYGDTTVKVRRGPFFERRMEKAVKRAIQLHDYGSIKAGSKQQQLNELNVKLNSVKAGWKE